MRVLYIPRHNYRELRSMGDDIIHNIQELGPNDKERIFIINGALSSKFSTDLVPHIFVPDHTLQLSSEYIRKYIIEYRDMDFSPEGENSTNDMYDIETTVHDNIKHNVVIMKKHFWKTIYHSDRQYYRQLVFDLANNSMKNRIELFGGDDFSLVYIRSALEA